MWFDEKLRKRISSLRLTKLYLLFSISTLPRLYSGSPVYLCEKSLLLSNELSDSNELSPMKEKCEDRAEETLSSSDESIVSSCVLKTTFASATSHF